MRKREFAKVVAEKTGLSLAKANDLVAIVFEEIGVALINGDEVIIGGFGKFYAKKMPERTWKNLKTGGSVLVPSMSYPRFRYSPIFKDLLV